MLLPHYSKIKLFWFRRCVTATNICLLIQNLLWLQHIFCKKVEYDDNSWRKIILTQRKFRLTSRKFKIMTTKSMGDKIELLLALLQDLLIRAVLFSPMNPCFVIFFFLRMFKIGRIDISIFQCVICSQLLPLCFHEVIIMNSFFNDATHIFWCKHLKCNFYV